VAVFITENEYIEYCELKRKINRLEAEKAELVKELKDALEQNGPRICAALARIKEAT